MVLPLRQTSRLLSRRASNPQRSHIPSSQCLQCLRSSRRHHHLTVYPRHKCIDKTKSGGEKGGGFVRGKQNALLQNLMMQYGRPPWPRPPTGSGVEGETKALVAPITQKEKYIIDQKQQNYIPITVSGIYSHSKIGNSNVMYNNPCPGYVVGAIPKRSPASLSPCSGCKAHSSGECLQNSPTLTSTPTRLIQRDDTIDTSAKSFPDRVQSQGTRTHAQDNAQQTNFSPKACSLQCRRIQHLNPM